MSNEAVMSEKFFLCTAKDLRGLECEVTLSPTSINASLQSNPSRNAKNSLLATEDIIGCLCMKSAPTTNQNRQDSSSSQNPCDVYLSVYAYILSKSFKKTPYRKRETMLLRCEKHSTFEENCEVVAR